MGYDRNDAFMTCGERDDRCAELGLAPLDHGDPFGEISELRTLIEDTVETLEAMNLHVDNPLYTRLRAALETP